MNFLLFLFITIILPGNMTLFDFNQYSDLSDWTVVDDVVMGGLSNGSFSINKAGNAVFEGKVSLDNNGGFSSVRYRFDQKKVSGFSVATIRLKGDGKRYQFRMKSDKYDPHSYIYYFETSKEWETVVIPLKNMTPSFRGRTLDMPNYPSKVLEEITFLIANKHPEHFKLEIDKITLQ